MNDSADLMSQTDARREARRLNESGEVPDGLIAVATTYPAGSWGGQEQGWTVNYVNATDIGGRKQYRPASIEDSI